MCRCVLLQHIDSIVEFMVSDPEDDCLNNERNGWTTPNPLHQAEQLAFYCGTRSTTSRQLTIKCGSAIAGIRTSPSALDNAVVNKKRAKTTDLR